MNVSERWTVLLRHALLGAVAGLSLGLAAAQAEETNTGLLTEYDADADSPIPNLVYDVALLPEGAPVDPAVVRADLDYVAGMRRHHAGALTMSRDYLADPQAANPYLRRLAQAIIPNQAFEIGVLDAVEQQVRRTPTLLDLGIVRLALRPAAVERLEQQRKFLKTPVPFIAEVRMDEGAPVSARDVQFAKAMSMHHRAAVEMAGNYNADPNAENSFLSLMNLRIITDQSQEIALMQAVIEHYPGDPDAVTVDPAMIHGMPMEGAGGHGGHGGHGAH